MWFPFCLFPDVLSPHIRTLRFKGCKFDRFHTKVEEHGSPAMSVSKSTHCLQDSTLAWQRIRWKEPGDGFALTLPRHRFLLLLRNDEVDPARSRSHCPQIHHNCQSIHLYSCTVSRLPNQGFRYLSYAGLRHLRLSMRDSFSPATTLERYTGRKILPDFECRVQYFRSMKIPSRSDLINALVTQSTGLGICSPC